MRYAFTFDASACTGCKACQVACKDKNALPAGVLWRRVYEVSGGAWQAHGAAWTNTVFAYNVSAACNHCAEPACARACPTSAYTVRDDGIVWLDGARCVGCEYCAWACPYSAPQYSRELGRTTKCDFCRDLIDRGLPPACVAACPMRALDVMQVPARGAAEEEPARGGNAVPLWATPPARHPYPLPGFSRTQPHVAIKPHAAMLNALPKQVANREEVQPPVLPPSGRLRRAAATLGEVPLVAFTLLGQAAAGAAIVSLLAGTPLERPLLLSIGLLGALAALVSLLHLGTVARAWRAPWHWTASALSREVILLKVFGAAWVVALFAPGAGHVALAISGAALVYGMAEVYRIDAVPRWNTWRTHMTFATSALVLGGAVVLTHSTAPRGWLFVLLAAAVFADQSVRRRRFYEARREKTM